MGLSFQFLSKTFFCRWFYCFLILPLAKKKKHNRNCQKPTWVLFSIVQYLSRIHLYHFNCLKKSPNNYTWCSYNSVIQMEEDCCNTFKRGFIYISVIPIKRNFLIFPSSSKRDISIFFCVQCQ